MKRNASILAALLILALVFTGYAPAARGASMSTAVTSG